MVVPPTPLPVRTKAGLRAAIRAARRAFVAGLAPGERARLEQALAARLRLFGGQPTASYAAMGAEIDPFAADNLAVPLLFPRVGNDRLTFHAAPRLALVPGFGGIAEPAATAPAKVPRIVLVPLVACDVAGNRIGQGAGHYDRSLAALRAAGAVTAIGLAWEVQIVAAIPADAWDEPLDWVATPARLVDCRASR